MQQDDDQRGKPPQGGDVGIGALADAALTSKFVILGQTSAGRVFRPSDWAERLAGVMAVFRPGKAGTQQHLAYSPYVVPSSQGGVRCVIVDPQLRELEPMAYSFVLNFARDNDLMTESLAPAPSARATPPEASS